MPVFAVCIAETDSPRVGGGREARRKLLSAEKNTWISLRDEISDVWPLKTIMSQQRSLKL